jgi:hypothetical protein
MSRSRRGISIKGFEDDDMVSTDLMAELLASVVHFMIRSGIGRKAVLDSLVACAERVRSRQGTKVTRDRPAIGCDAVAGTVMRAWHRLPNYLDDSAKPRPLNLNGPGPSLSDLIRNAGSRANVETMVDAMAKGGLVRQNSKGMYLATKDSATICAMHPFIVNHVAKTIVRLVETLERNTESSRVKSPLIERYAYISNLPALHAKDFAKFSHQKGQAFLDSVEDWLVARQPKGASKKAGKSQGATSAGVHVFAYLSSPPAKKTQRAPKTRRRTPTSARAATA